MKPSPADVKVKIFESIGEASMCWHPRPAGVFDSDHASKVAQDLFDYLVKSGAFDSN
jgi:hypothetical protein